MARYSRSTCSVMSLDAIAGRRYHRCMRIRVLYFAVFREQIGRDDDVVELAGGARVRDAVAALAERHPAIAKLRGKSGIAVTGEFRAEAGARADANERALIPPVAGGT